MNWQRNIILATIGVVAWTLMLRWSDFQDQQELQVIQDQPEVQEELQQTPSSNQSASSSIPVVAYEKPKPVVSSATNDNNITVTTDVLKIVISPFGGDIVEAQLLEYLTKMPEEGGEPITLLQRNSMLNISHKVDLLGVMQQIFQIPSGQCLQALVMTINW